jgi:selenocysteine-specific elongation factor
MTEQNFIIATAGHVDHGKSALVKALTGTDPDRLPEEKARGITIDLGFANLRLTSNDATYNIGIVDVPGHEDFVKNMVAGVGAIDVALFVVAADDGWMPQTEEHLHILTYLGITRAVVALTKSDLAQNLEQSLAQIRERLTDSPFANAQIVPTSVITGSGIDELKQALMQCLAQTPTARDIGKPRLPVDRVFTLRGVGTVVTGTLMGGKISRGDAIIVQSVGASAKIRSVQTHNAEIEAAVPGSRTALNIPDLQAHQTVYRGDVITLAELGKPTTTLDVQLTKLGRITTEKLSPLARPLKDGTRIRVHHGTSDIPARVLLLDTKQLSAGESALAELRLEMSICAVIGDHFIIRDWAQQTTLAGGVILDSQADPQRFRTEEQKQLLKALSEPRPSAEPCASASGLVHAFIVRDHFSRFAELLVQSKFSAAEISAAVSQLAAANKLIVRSDWVINAQFWTSLQTHAAQLIDAAHKAKPDAPGLLLSELRIELERGSAESAVKNVEIFNLLVAELTKKDFTQSGTAIKRATHRLSLPPQLQTAGTKVRAALAAKPLDPPSRKELAPDALTQQALRFLINSGEAVELSDEVAISSQAFAVATETIRKFLRQHTAATVSDLRQALGASRRIVVPLLEKLDKTGVTRREGDKRSLR